MNHPPRALVLASESPRRLKLLREAGYAVEVVASQVDETWPDGQPPAAAVVNLALRKAEAVAASHQGQPVIGADTAVVIGNQVLGKPASRTDAARMLQVLSGQTHTVYSGVAMVRDDVSHTGCAESDVTFRQLSNADIEAYLNTATYRDKAGAYGIQAEGRELVASHTGRFDTIVGLPMNVVEDLWQQIARAA